MNINKYTEKAREAVAGAIELAQHNNNPQLEPEHLLVTLVEQREGIVPELLRKMNIDPAAVVRGGRDLLKKLPQAYGGAQPGMSSRLNLVTDKAQVEADHLKDEYVSTEHLFIAIADESGRSPGAQLLKQNGISAVFHYVPLHTSVMGRKFGYREGDLPLTEDLSGRLLRMPFYAEISRDEQMRVVRCLSEFLEHPHAASPGRQQQ